MKRLVSLFLALLLTLSAVLCATAEGVVFETSYYTLTLPDNWDFDNESEMEDGDEYLGCFYSTKDIGLFALCWLTYEDTLKDTSLWSATDAEVRAYAEDTLEGFAEDDPVLVGIEKAGGIPFVLIKGEDEDGEYLYAETCTNGYVIAFAVYVVDADFHQYPIKDRHIEQFRSILATFLPVA